MSDGLVLSSNQLLVIIVAAVLMVAPAIHRVHRTKMRHGHAREVALNPQAAQLVGINKTTSSSASLRPRLRPAGPAAFLYAMNYPSIDPLMGVMPGMKAFVAAVLGGRGEHSGAALAASSSARSRPL